MLHEYQLQNFNRPLSCFLRGSAHGDDLNLVPEYQRGSVWTDEQRRNLIRSVLEGLPIGAIFLNERSVFESAVVDGKQRIETLRAFVAGEFGVPASWLRSELARHLMWWEDWTDAERRHFLNSCVATYETHFHAPDHAAAEAELFMRLNFGGTPQSPEDRARVEAMLAVPS